MAGDAPASIRHGDAPTSIRHRGPMVTPAASLSESATGDSGVIHSRKGGRAGFPLCDGVPTGALLRGTAGTGAADGGGTFGTGVADCAGCCA